MNERQIIARNIKLMREASDFTQQHVADFLSIQRSTYSNYETGDRELPLSHMEKLANLYGCDTYDLYDESGDVMESMPATAFRVENLSPDDMAQIAYFKRIIKHYLKIEPLL